MKKPEESTEIGMTIQKLFILETKIRYVSFALNMVSFGSYQETTYMGGDVLNVVKVI